MHENTNARGRFVYRYVSYGYSIQECTSYLVQTREAEPEVTYWSSVLANESEPCAYKKVEFLEINSESLWLSTRSCHALFFVKGPINGMQDEDGSELAG